MAATETTAKPGLALALATGLGAGYVPRAPGTAGSLVSLLLYLLLERAAGPALLWWHLALNVALVLVGVWAAGRAAHYLGRKDPTVVVIDEISGQQIAFLGLTSASWPHLAAAFLLFRAFDIWKPFPVRRLEALPGGWGVMADDWLAGAYAAVAVWALQFVGL